MAVFRVEKNHSYTVMANHHLRDERLSLKSKGLLSVILSLPDDWRISIEGMTQFSADDPQRHSGADGRGVHHPRPDPQRGRDVLRL